MQNWKPQFRIGKRYKNLRLNAELELIYEDKKIINPEMNSIEDCMRSGKIMIVNREDRQEKIKIRNG